MRKLLYQKFINQRRYSFSHYRGYPTLFIVGKDGTILHKSNGYTEGLENEYLQELLKYLDSENIDYGDFEYERQLEEKNDASVTVDF